MSPKKIKNNYYSNNNNNISLSETKKNSNIN